MKIVQTLDTAYNNRLPLIQLLRRNVDEKITTNKKYSWHYFSRIKSLESYALKMETGRVKNTEALEDFLGCTIVVENINEIKNAINFLDKDFTIKYRKPKDENITHKSSYEFSFDDLRLYVTLKTFDYLPKTEFDNIVFEIQIKTFLQHAWGIATHDMIYKSSTISWSKERIAYQIKAMLEQAEISISGVDALSNMDELSKQNYESIRQNEVMTFLIESFPKENLPTDLLRLSNNVINLLYFFRIELSDLKGIVLDENKLGRGTQLLNLSPYGIIIQSIINQKKSLVEAGFKNNNNKKVKGFYIPLEIDLSNINIESQEKLIRI